MILDDKFYVVRFMEKMKKIKKTIKHIFGNLLWYWCSIRALVEKRCHSNTSKKEIIEELRRVGYTFPNPMPTCPPLCKDKIDLSIIVPIYNVSKYLRKCIESIVHNETTYSYEVICVNDGSTDNSLDILHQLAEQYPQIAVYSQSNKGLSAARNKGLIHARGKYISFVDSDDWVEKNYIQSLTDTIIETDADVVQANYMIVDEDSSWTTIGQQKDNVVFDITNREKYEKYLHGFMWAAIYKKVIFESIRCPNGFMFEDNITLFLIIPYASKVAIIKESLYNYLIRNTGLCHDKTIGSSVRCIDQCWMYLSIMDYWTKVLHKPINQESFNNLILGLSTMLYARTSQMSPSIKRAMFDLSAAYIQEWNFDYYPQNRYCKLIYYAFLNNDYKLYLQTIIAFKWKRW